MQHTRGPWHLIDQTEVRNANGCTVCVTSEYRVPGREQEAIADARLIAAAPDLLAALQDLANFDDWSCHENQIGFVMRDIARCALAEMMDEDTQPGATK